jgi:hypothetical protein
MHPAATQKRIHSDYSIETGALDRRVTLRLDRDSSKCLELAFAAAATSDLCPFKDRASYLRWLIHESYREIVERDNAKRPSPPVIFEKRHAAQ